MPSESEIIPDFPRTRHLPHKANTSKGDSVATEAECKEVFKNELSVVEEKIDGANTGMCLYQGNPIIRNRNHILNKAFIQRRTAAKMQFASIFNWFYDNMEKFEALNDILGFEAAVYGEWMYAVHGIKYTKLPEVWIPYDIYDWQAQKFVCTQVVRESLEKAGFWTTPLLHKGVIKNWEQLEALCNEQSAWSGDPREGIYLKINNDKWVTDRFKMVRHGFLQGSLWSDDKITRNIVEKN
jgi:ATP-dependent RNA circularization protein (DNA/RNA ligase family)